MNEPTVSGLVFSLAANTLDTLRRNKLPAALSIAALVVTSAVVFTSHYDERGRYRRVILPEIRQAEARFLGTIKDAENAASETWRLHYFLAAHQRARDVLGLARSRWPKTPEAIKAHRDLVRYYELVTEQLAIIRTEMSIDLQLEYLAAWREEELRLRRVRESWLHWVDEEVSASVVSVR